MRGSASSCGTDTSTSLRARRVHPLEPDSRALAQRVGQPVQGPDRPGSSA